MDAPRSSELPAGADELPGHRILNLEFHGDAREYFRIWIVNLALTLATLGIYSAWAKVRKMRYFYGRTLLDGAPFDYLASPLSILKGRLIAVALLLSYIALGYLVPGSELVFWILIGLAVPWLVVRALAFRLRNSAHRGIRFGFKEKYAQAVGIFILLPIAIVFSLGLAYPYLVYRKKRFVPENAEYGATDFLFTGTKGPFFAIYIAAVGILICLALAGSFLGTAAALVSGSGALLVSAMLLVAYLGVWVYLHTATLNYTWNHTRLAGNGFHSTLKTWPLLGLYITNAIAVIMSLGLLVPWASVRLVRYRVEHTALLAAHDLGDFAAADRDQVAATGEEVGDMFDVGIGM